MAHILFLTQVLPYPLDSGAKIRAYYVLRRLAQTHQLTLVSFTRPDDPTNAVTHLAEICQAVYTVPMVRSRLRDVRAAMKAGLTGRPAIILRDEIGAMQALLRRLVAETHFDAVHADQTSMAQYARYAQSKADHNNGRTRPKLLLDAHNALYRIPQRMADHETNPLKQRLLRREADALARYEANLCHRFDRVVFVTDVDRRELARHAGADNPSFSTIPICIDPADRPLIERQPGSQTITHLGTMFWPPNVEGVAWFAQHVFPLISAAAPEAEFVIIGKNPPPEIAALPDRYPGIRVTGYIPDPAPYLADTAIFIVPLHAGGGMRVKILDAWCWGLPLVSTTIGAEGIPLQNGKHALIADTPQALADAVIKLLKDPALGERLRQNGRRWVTEQFDWQQVYPKWDLIYEALLHHAPL